MPIKSSSFVYAPVAPPGSTEKEWKQCFCGSLWRWASAWFEEFPLQGPQLLMIQEAALEIFCNTLEYMNQQKVMNKVPIEFFMFFHAQYKKKHLITKQRRTWSGTSGINGAGVPPFVKGKSLFHTCWNHLNLGQSHSACQLEPLKHGIPHYSSLAHQAFDSVGRLHNKYHQVRFSG